MPMQISGVTIQGGMNILPRAGAPSPSPTPGPAPGPSDPDFSNVVFMFDGDGTDGGANNTFTDASPNGHTITENGDVTQGSFSPYGDNWSNYFDGSGDYLTISQSSSLDLGSGDFTVEAWIYAESATQDSQFRRILATSTNASSAVQLYINTSGQVVYTADDDVSRLTGTTNVLNGWHHVALVRQGSSGSNIELYVDGSLEGSFTDTSSKNSSSFHIGKYPGASGHFKGYISNIRMVKGTAVYTSSFTPSTSPLTNITNTSLLTCQSNRFADNSSNGFTISVNGDTKVTPFSPFAPTAAYSPATRGGSGLFATGDGTTNNLTATVNAIGTNNFTIEMWLYNTEQNNQPILDLGGYTDGISIRYDQTGTDRISGYIKGGDLTYVNDPTPNQWIHFALTRSGSTVKAFYNGIQTLSTTNSSDLTRTNLKIGGINSGGVGGNDSYTGYMSDVRIVIGDALYTTDFTPPTAPLTAVTNTELLLDFQDSAIYDYSGQNNVDTVGNAQINTSIKKFGTGSVKFDGTGDYLEIPSSDAFDLGTDDWTIEGWIYPETDSDDRGAVFELYNDDNNVLRIMIQANDEIEFRVESGGTRVVDIRSTNWNYDEWMHVAAVNNSGTITLYLNGTSEGTDSSFTMPDFSSARVLLGMDLLATDRWYTGYIDDFRVTKGVARYTSNFTAPTEALPKF